MVHTAEEREATRSMLPLHTSVMGMGCIIMIRAWEERSPLRRQVSDHPYLYAHGHGCG